MIREAKPADFAFINKILQANHLTEWSRERFDDLSAPGIEHTMLVDEGVGFAAAGAVEKSETEAYSSHMLRVPTDAAALETWHKMMMAAMLKVAFQKMPKLQTVHVKLARQVVDTCIQPTAFEKSAGVISYDEGDSIDIVIDAAKVLAWADVKAVR